MDRPWQPEFSSLRRQMRSRGLGNKLGRATEIDPYIYSIERQVTVAASATVTPTIALQADAIFVAEVLLFWAWVATDDVVQDANELVQGRGAFTLSLRDTGSGRELMDRQIIAGLVTGTGERPFYLPVSKHFRPNGAVTVTLTNLDTVLAYDCQLAIAGIKQYTYDEVPVA